MSTVADTLAQARSLHREGQSAAAEQLCRQVLRVDAANIEALYLLGVVSRALGKPQQAIETLSAALRANPRHAEAHQQLGIVFAAEGRLDEAEGCFRNALDLRPTYTAAYGNLGNVLWQKGRLAEAADCFRRVLELNPESAQANNELGGVLGGLGQFAAAIVYFRRAVALKPDYAEAIANLATALANDNSPAEAAASYRQALLLRPGDTEMHRSFGALLKEQGQLADAIPHLRQAVELAPESIDAQADLASALAVQGALREAEACHRRVLAIKPDSVEAHHNLGMILERQGKFDEALACFARAIELKPACAEARNGRAMTMLRLGQFAAGWPEYEWRFKCPGIVDPLAHRSRWNGAVDRNARVLLHSEQGFGDTLQFIRYAELVKQRSGTVIVECEAPLTRLLASCAGIDSLVPRGQPLPEFDSCIPLVSVPGVLGTTLADIPAKVPYLFPDAELVAKWKAEPGRDENALKIGIAWQGNPTHVADRSRSFPLAHFAALATQQDVQFYSLQMGTGREQLRELAGQLPIVDLGERLGDFHNTAAIVRNLDLVITCDSAPAHLAGALGVPVWVALTFVPDWRWLWGRDDSPWYPTMRLFRQSSPGDWRGVFERIRIELAELAAGKSRD